MPRPSPSHLSAPVCVATGLLILAALCFAYLIETDEPWDGESLKRTARALEIEPEAVPRSTFYDFEALGSYNLGVDVYCQIGWWYGALFVGIALVLAAIGSRWWVPLTFRRPRGGNALTGASPRTSFHPRAVDWAGLGAILLFAAFLRAPHLDRALYFDEQDNLRRNFHGYIERRTDGQETWKEVGWREALFENRLGNNPILYSVACQASLRAWRCLAGAERQRFDITALRMPALLAGLASIAATWWLLQLWGLRFSAAFAGLLAAIHPMHVDYSLQARGYALVLLFVPLALGFAWLALKRNLWRYWLALTFSVFFCLWSYAGSVYFALALNAGILALLVARRVRSGDPGLLGPISRLLGVNAITALLYLLLIFPHLPQVKYHFRQVFELIPLEPFWMVYAWAHYSTGTNFPVPSDIIRLREGETTLWKVLTERIAPTEPLLAALQWGLIPLLLVIGICWLRNRQRHDGRLIPATLLLGLSFLAPLLALLHQQFTSLYFYYWYLSYALPAVIAGTAIGFERLILPLLSPPHSLTKAAFSALVTTAFFGLFFWQVIPLPDRDGRVNQDPAWPISEDGIAAVEFKRGRSHWIATRDGLSICERDVYDPQTGKRAGR